MAALADEQAALRRVATLVAGGRPQTEILEAVTREAGYVYGAQSVDLVKSEGVPNEAVVVAGWSDGPEPACRSAPTTTPEPQSATMRALDVRAPGPSRGVVARARLEIRDRRAGDRQRAPARRSHGETAQARRSPSAPRSD